MGAAVVEGPDFNDYCVTSDGQRFLMVREVERPPARVSQMVLVQNWKAPLPPTWAVGEAAPGMASICWRRNSFGSVPYRYASAR